jgi:HK97 family phage prohead protease
MEQVAKTDIETRNGEVEFRALPDGGAVLRGYAAKFNSPYDMGWFTEDIAPTAFQNADLTDVRALLNHDANVVLGRTVSGTLSVSVDNVGLAYEIKLPDTQASRDLQISVQRGDISQSSWAFMLRQTPDNMGDRWERKNGKDHRTLMDISKVLDVSPVTYPANPATSTQVAKRNHDATLGAEEQYTQTLTRRAAQVRIMLAKQTQK